MHLSPRSFIGVVATATVLLSSSVGADAKAERMVRLSEIEVAAGDLAAYRAILKEEAEASVRLEPGVIAIFPMLQKEHPTQVRILEIYASRAAYESHLQTPHFQRYKTSTLSMVKSLRLIDMDELDERAVAQVFRKAE